MAGPTPMQGEVPVAYVEVNENSGLTSDDIMAWAKTHIGERAAIPKEIIVTDQIPLTAVGKVFKPALKWDAIRRVYEKELAGLKDLAKSVDVIVAENKVHGESATITVTPLDNATPEQIRQKISDLLARYTVHYTVVVN